LPQKYLSIGYVESLSKIASKDQAFQNEATHTAYVRLYKPINVNIDNGFGAGFMASSINHVSAS
jgi:hypothetical protein